MALAPSLLGALQLSYALALRAKNLAYARGWMPVRALDWPAVSIGNLSVGGAGKTPVVIALAALLREQGWRVDVLSRGYRRRSPQAIERVDPEGDALRFGDEPVLIARTGVPVYVGASRWGAGRLAEREAGGIAGKAGRVHLLDDGFQHRRLGRAVDIVVIHPADHWDRLLPAGRLREPLAALGRADILVLREDDATSEARLRQAGLHQPVWRVRRVVSVPQIEGPAIAFCGIAHPQEFFAGLRAQGLALRETLAFGDHHRYTPRDIATLAGRAQGAGALLTTEKDLVRLTPEARSRLEGSAPLHAAGLRAEFLDPECLVQTLAGVLEGRREHAGSMRK